MPSVSVRIGRAGSGTTHRKRGLSQGSVYGTTVEGSISLVSSFASRRTRAGEVVSRSWNNFQIQVEFNAVKIQYLVGEIAQQ